MKQPLKIFIGWDSREDIAYQVCKKSILENTNTPVEIIPLKQRELRKTGVYTRELDELASTEFTFTRFLVPYLTDYDGWALFIDCDFLFLDDVKKLFDQKDNTKAVMCVHHDYTPKPGRKMDGQKQSIYPRKNWSSMVLWNCGHPANKLVTPDYINDMTKTGAHFHRFNWLSDKEIGSVSKEWNWLVGWYQEPKDGSPKALHYTEGGPWFEDYQTCEYATDWNLCKGRYYEEYSFDLEQKLWEHKNKVVDVTDLSMNEKKKEVVSDFFNSLLDQTGNTYKNIEERVLQGRKQEMGKKVAAIAPDKNDFNLAHKGVEYDPYCKDFIIGSGGIISYWDLEEHSDRELVIRGLGGTSQKALKHCMDKGRTFYAIDTGYMQPGSKKEYHRVTKNALQNLGPMKERPFDRLRRLNWNFKKHRPGSKILVCPPSEKVMKFYGLDLDEWMKKTVKEIKQHTDRPVEIRLKPNRSDRVTDNTIWTALEDVHCLVTFNSIAATEALLASVPAVALAPNAAQMMCNTKLMDIEDRLVIPTKDELLAFAAHLSYCQFTPQELRTGFAWKILNNLDD